jgi:hypothetical protein
MSSVTSCSAWESHALLVSVLHDSEMTNSHFGYPNREEFLVSIWCRGWLDQCHGEQKFNQLYGAQRFLHSELFPSQSKISAHLIETEDSLTCSQQPAGCSYSETELYFMTSPPCWDSFNTIVPSKPRSSMYHISFRSYNRHRTSNYLFRTHGTTPPTLSSLTLLTTMTPVNETRKYYNELKRRGKEIILYL